MGKGGDTMPVKPSRELEQTVNIINEVFGKRDYWLCFGGLWGIIMNDGVIPDDDVDVGVLYPYDWRRVEKRFRSYGYRLSKAMVNDQDQNQVLYAGFEHSQRFHICVSFWYPHDGYRYFCHDSQGCIPAGSGAQIPSKGYSFKGVPAYAVEDQERGFKMVDWPGLPGKTKVRVPIYPGVILDHLYPAWAFRKQRYVLQEYGEVHHDKMASYHKGGAISPMRIHARSMADFNNAKFVQNELERNTADYRMRLKLQKK